MTKSDSETNIAKFDPETIITITKPYYEREYRMTID